MTVTATRPGVDLVPLRTNLMERAHTSDGATCDLCLQHVQVYPKRSITSRDARALIKLYNLRGRTWSNLAKDLPLKVDGGITVLALWGLLEPEDPSCRKRTRWRITADGQAFLRRELRVQKWAKTFNGELLELHGPPVGLTTALGKHFNYAEMVGR